MTALDTFSITSLLTSPESLSRSDTQETLGSILSLVESSHEPVLIYSPSGSFLGMVSPYQALYSKRYPYTTKVGTIATRPPSISVETPIHEIAALMLESKVYALPVFNGNRNDLVGIITARAVLKQLLDEPELISLISELIQPNTPITAPINSKVGDIYNIIRDLGISRVILTDDNGTLAGIVSRKDLLQTFMKPTPKQRFGKRGNPSTNVAFDNEKIQRKDAPIRHFAQEKVESVPDHVSLHDAISRLIESKHSSLVITDSQNTPVGFISLHDLIEGLSSLRNPSDVRVILKKPKANIQDAEVEEAEELLTRFGEKLQKRLDVMQIEVSFDVPKYQTGRPVEFNASVIVTPRAGSKLIAQTKRGNLLESLHAATRKIEKQEQVSGRTRGQSRHA
jgi:CBS domain-containing protein